MQNPTWSLAIMQQYEKKDVLIDKTVAHTIIL